MVSSRWKSTIVDKLRGVRTGSYANEDVDPRRR